MDTDANPVTQNVIRTVDEDASADESPLLLDMFKTTSQAKPDSLPGSRSTSPVYADVSRPQSATQDETETEGVTMGNAGNASSEAVLTMGEDVDPDADDEQHFDGNEGDEETKEESNVSASVLEANTLPYRPFRFAVMDREETAVSTPRLATTTERGRGATKSTSSSSEIRAKSVPANSRSTPRFTGATSINTAGVQQGWPSLRSQITSPHRPLGVGLGQSDPSGKKYVASQRDPTGSLSPGARFGYWRAKPFILNNVGDVKDYRTARQVVLDAEVAMNKTIMMERLRAKKTVAASHRAQRQLEECLDEERSWRDAILQEKEMAYEAMERGMMDAEDMRMRLHGNLVFQSEAEARVGFFKMQADQYRQQFVEREQHLTDLRRQLREALESESAARNATQSMAKQLGADRTMQLSTNGELRKELERRGQELVDLHQAHDRLKQHHTTVTVEKDRAVKLMEQLTARLKELQGSEVQGLHQRQTLVQRAEVLQSAAETQVAKARDLARLTVKSSQSAMATLQAEHEKCKQALRVAEDKAKDLHAQLVASNDAGTKARRELSSSKREVAALRKELDAARLDAEAMREHLGMSKAEAGKLRAESERLRVEAERLRNSRSVDVDSLAGTVSGLTSEAQRHQTEAVAALKAVAEAQSRVRVSTGTGQEVGSGPGPGLGRPGPTPSPTPDQLHTDILASIAQFQGALVAGAAHTPGETGAMSGAAAPDVSTMGPQKPSTTGATTKSKKANRRHSTVGVDYDPLTGRLVSNRPVRKPRRRKSAAMTGSRRGGAGTSGCMSLPSSVPSATSLLPTPPTVEPGDTLVKVNNDDTCLAPSLMVLTTNGWKHPSKLAVGDTLFHPSADGSSYEQTIVESISTCFAGPYTLRPGMLDVKYVVSHVDPGLLSGLMGPMPSSPGSKKSTTKASTPKKLRRKASKMKVPDMTPGETTPLEAGAPPAGKAYLVRPPEGLCGVGINATPVQPPSVYTDSMGRFQVTWTCCQDKGLASHSFIPSHHSNKTLIAIDCPIIALVNL